MLFTEGRFFILFAIAFGVYWALNKNESRKLWLLACSAVFYGAWDWRYLFLMYGSIVIDYTMGRLLGADKPPFSKRAWLVVSIVANLSILGFFKYYGFFVDSGIELFRWLGFHPSDRTLKVLVPIGVSFYTFQSMSYTIDVYRGHLKAVRKFSDFALFVSFFPQLVAGPIVRAVDFVPQLGESRLWRDVRVRAALSLFLIGFAKKACIADQIAAIADPVFLHPQNFDALSNWMATMLYHVQIYCDFSGYSDMAIATAGLLGYKLTKNFDFPHLQGNIKDWWATWHISLSSWLRDYLYFPLGGSKRGPLRTYYNLMVVFLLSGLWHGASWNWVCYGLLQGTYMSVHRAYTQAGLDKTLVGRGIGSIAIVVNTFFLLLSWTVMRGTSLTQTWTQLSVMFGRIPGGVSTLSLYLFPMMGVLALIHWGNRKRVFARLLEPVPDWAFTLGYGVAFPIVLLFVATGYQPFIYFQF